MARGKSIGGYGKLRAKVGECEPGGYAFSTEPNESFQRADDVKGSNAEGVMMAAKEEQIET